MELFFSSGAGSLAPHIVLKETQLSFKLEKIEHVALDLADLKHLRDYLARLPAVRPYARP
ncbi:hypothetical protein LP417_31075 [Polaromonas sp. P1-6]|nr:hypothetical protein LP417_31075 [Polaromonas sp. P1-6]